MPANEQIFLVGSYFILGVWDICSYVLNWNSNLNPFYMSLSNVFLQEIITKIVSY
jgi:hypothetical protein